MGESVYRSSKQRNKITVVMDAKYNNEGVVTVIMGRWYQGTEKSQKNQ